MEYNKFFGVALIQMIDAIELCMIIMVYMYCLILSHKKICFSFKQCGRDKGQWIY